MYLSISLVSVSITSIHTKILFLFLYHGVFHAWQSPDSEVKVAQLCPTFCDPMDYTVQGILQARILEWVPQTFLSLFQLVITKIRLKLGIPSFIPKQISIVVL